MKNKNYIAIALISVSLFSANVSRAAFAIKKDATKTEIVSTAPAQSAAEDEAAPAVSNSAPAVSATENKVIKKQSFFSRVFSKRKEAAIPKVLYIILAIIGLGWLGMGINENFGSFDWVLSLILYIIFYLPGLIYTLIKMKKYY